MAYTQSAGVSGVDAFMSFLRSSLSGSGLWKYFAMNTSSLHPNAGLIGREDIYRADGTSTDPTRFYVSVHRNTQGNCCDDRVQFMGFSGCKGFETPIPIQIISKSAGVNVTVQVTCSVPHNFAGTDHVMVNGTPRSSSFHEGWSGGEGHPTFGGYVIQVNGTASFNYVGGFTGPEGANQTSGGYAIAVYNQVSTRNTGVNSGHGLTLNDANMAVFMYYDEYRFCGLVNQGGTYQTFYIGETARDHIPQDFNSRAFLSVSQSAGAITASLDRSVDNLRVGQKIWFVHASGTGGTGSVERTTITSRPNSSSFGCTLVNSYNSGSLVGEDALPVFILAGIGTTAATQALGSRTVRFIFHLDGTRDPTNEGSAQTLTPFTDAGYSEASIDPDGAGYYQGRDIFMQRLAAPSGIRGRLVGMISFPIDVQNDQDLMRIGADAVTDDFKFFVSSTVDGGFAVGIGPGAS